MNHHKHGLNTKFVTFGQVFDRAVDNMMNDQKFRTKFDNYRPKRLHENQVNKKNKKLKFETAVIL